MGNLDVNAKNRVEHTARQTEIKQLKKTSQLNDNQLADSLANKSKKLQNDYVTNTKDNIFLKEYFEGSAMVEGVTIPAGMEIKVSNYKGEKYRDILSGSLTKAIPGIMSEKYWDDFLNTFKSNSKDKSIEDYCREKGLNAEETEKVMELYRFHDVRVNVFKARIKDMFTLLSKDKEEIVARVDKMKIPDEQKQEILQVKDFLDKYYRVEAEYDGKTYNLLNLSKEEKDELKEISPEFLQFAEKMSPELRKQSAYFAQKEMQSDELADAGQTSKYIAFPLMGALGIGLWKGYVEGKEMKEGIKNSEEFAKFIRQNPKEGHAILDKCVAKYNKLNKNGTVYVLADGEEKTGISKLLAKAKGKITGKPPKLFKQEPILKGTKLIERYMRMKGFEGGEYLVYQKAIQGRGLQKWVNPITKFKNAKGAALMALVSGTMMLSMDDCLGAGKDFFQDQNNFGSVVGAAFAGAGIGGGIASSAAIFPTFQGIVDYIRADKTLRKMGVLPKLNIANKFLHRGKLALIGIPLGLVLASTSSGSSWTSMGLTRWMIGKNGDELVKKNIIDEKDNTFKAANENMMEYEAYKGKWEGITIGYTGDWTIGTIGGATGVFTHPHPVIQNTFTTLQGCSETLTASGYQILGNTMRNVELNKQKQKLVDSVK